MGRWTRLTSFRLSTRLLPGKSTVTWVPIIPVVLHLVLLGRHLESPRWLVRQGKIEIAREVLVRLREEWDEDCMVSMELRMLQESSDKSMNVQKGTNVGVDKEKRNRAVQRAYAICMVCAIAQQFSGINNAFNYSSQFLTQNGISPATVTAIAVLMNVGNVVITLVATKLMDQAGRKQLMLISSSGMLASILVLTMALTNPGQSWTSPLAIIAVVSFVMSFGIGMGPVPWLLPAELFQMDMCAKGTSVAATSNWLANFLVVQAFPVIQNSLQGFAFMPFAVVLCVFIAFVLTSVPETRGKSLNEISKELAGSKSSSPTGYVILDEES